jgi:hypothetical protein
VQSTPACFRFSEVVTMDIYIYMRLHGASPFGGAREMLVSVIFIHGVSVPRLDRVPKFFRVGPDVLNRP